MTCPSESMGQAGENTESTGELQKSRRGGRHNSASGTQDGQGREVLYEGPAPRATVPPPAPRQPLADRGGPPLGPRMGSAGPQPMR